MSRKSFLFFCFLWVMGLHLEAKTILPSMTISSFKKKNTTRSQILQDKAICLIEQTKKIHLNIVETYLVGKSVVFQRYGKFLFNRSPLSIHLITMPTKEYEKKIEGQEITIKDTMVRVYTQPKKELVYEGDIGLSPFATLLVEPKICANFSVVFEPINDTSFILYLTHHQDMSGNYIKLLFSLNPLANKTSYTLMWNGWVVVEPEGKETVINFVEK
jgi:hypothetical protein